MKRVAFFLQGNPGSWLGGLTYIRNLVAAVYSNADRRIEPILFVDPLFDCKYLTGFPEIEIVRTPLLSPTTFTQLAGRVSRLLLQYDYSLESLLQQKRVDILSHSGITGKKSRIPSICWIPDFQHIRFPHYFSKQEAHRRTVAFRRIIKGCDRLILSSHDAQSDFHSFAQPVYSTKSRVLQFASCPPANLNILSLDQIYARFNIDSYYFHLPNQFWLHKNHAVVIDSLSILKQRGINVTVLATGVTADYRNPLYFEHITARAKLLGIEENFRVLGVVNLQELYSLMVNAVALINPSNFEGWSTSVEESKSLGVPIVLSNIPVHIEQAPPLGRYFAPDSPEELADTLLDVIRDHDPLIAQKNRLNASIELPSRVKRYGKTYEKIALELVDDLSC